MSSLDQQAVIDAYKELGNVEAVAKKLDLPLDQVTELIDNFPLRELYRHKGTQEGYSEQALKGYLRQAAAFAGEPLTIPGYRKAAKAIHLPHDLTIIRHFGSFEAACVAAGVEANPAQGPRAFAITEEQCLAALRQYRQERGDIPSLERYSAWARENGRPSGATVRAKSDGWSKALKAAFE